MALSDQPRPLLFGVLQAGLTEPSTGLPTPSRRHGGGCCGLKSSENREPGEGCQGPACHLCFPQLALQGLYR